MSDLVLRDVRDGVCLLTLNRPERMNAWTHELEARYFDLLEEADRDPGTRAVVVTGAGRGFCPGFDMDALAAMSAGEGNGAAQAPRRPQTFPLTVRKPIVAAINGACAGIGLVQALMCDLRFAAAGVKLTTAFARRGLVAEHGSSWLLPRLVGPAHALDLLLSGRVFLAEEAERLGVVNRVLPGEQLLGHALAYARDLAANCSPASMAAMKAQVYRDLERGLDESLEDADRLMLESFARPDFGEGVQSFVERRPPSFAGLDPQ
ncbi:MAG TPA: enoyl-CoA hydratase [Solirubrobacteraceae bacterium]|nr:enoyl-CoA hydratase [Solirubrobacteraceae bacterium]